MKVGAESVDEFGWIGQVLDDRYQIEAVVGRGGFGVVYRGRHLTLGRPVAIKFLNLSRSLDEDRRKRVVRAFAEEGRILAKLKSPLIVEVHDFRPAVSPSGQWMPYLALEWLDGVTLDRLLEEPRRPLSPQEMLRFLRPIAKALEVAHAKGIAHRDVKPGNVFVLDAKAPEPVVKVLDFGIAKVLEDQGLATTSFDPSGRTLSAFTPAYAAPEQFDPSIGPTGTWTDVHALGLIAVEMLTGRGAYEVATPAQAVAAATSYERPTPAAKGVEVPPALERSLNRALALDPRNRPPTAAAFLSSIEEAVAGAESSSPRSRGDSVGLSRATTSLAGNARSVPKPSKSRRGLRVSIVLIVLLGAMRGAFLLNALLKPEAPNSSPPAAGVGNWTDHLSDSACATPCAGGTACVGSKACPSRYTCIPGTVDTRLASESWSLHLAGAGRKSPASDACKDPLLRKGEVCVTVNRTAFRRCIPIAEACDNAGWSLTSVPIVSEDLVDRGFELEVNVDGRTIAARSGAKYSKMVQRRAVCVGIVFDAPGQKGGQELSLSFFLAPR